MRDKISRVLEEIKSVQKQEVTLIAVSKNHPKEQVIEAKNLGLVHFGENRVQELIQKYEENDGIIWHFIGSLQTNKVKDVVSRCALIHSVDRISLAKEIDKQAKKINKIMDVLIQVNISLEETKSGVLLEDLDDLIDEVLTLKNIRIKGLMTIGPNTDDEIRIREVFKTAKQTFDRLNESKHLQMDVLSMGMSSDLSLAILEGSTMVRVGTAIFGERNYNHESK